MFGFRNRENGYRNPVPAGVHVATDPHDISQFLRGLRRAKRNKDNEIIFTTGELLRDEQVQAGFGSEDQMADTKVKTAIAWLERAGLVERNQNYTRVFQGQPLVRNLEEAGEKISRLGLQGNRK